MWFVNQLLMLPLEIFITVGMCFIYRFLTQSNCFVIRGMARRISLRSLGWDVRLHLDGIYSIPLEYGVQAVMKIGTNPHYALQTVEFEG